MSEYLTTRELAALLRVKERKVYELAASDELPCSRATGKLLFPRRAVETWLAAKGSGFAPLPSRPDVVLGSHDPLLEWALRESGCGLASFFDGSLDGLERFAAGAGVASGLHLLDPASGEWNVPAVRERFAAAPVVLVEWAWRERGLVVAPGEERSIGGLADLRGRRLVPRQPAAGCQGLLERLLAEAGVGPEGYDRIAPARTESDAALAVLEGKAEAAFGLRALATQYRLGFVPVIRERYDLLIERRAWFEPPWQRLLTFCRGPAFAARLAELAGYDCTRLGRVHFNGP